VLLALRMLAQRDNIQAAPQPKPPQTVNSVGSATIAPIKPNTAT
jgi:hypothetical protein